MSDEQTTLSWLAIIGLFIAIWLVYKPTLSAIIFGTTTTSVNDTPPAGTITGGSVGNPTGLPGAGVSSSGNPTIFGVPLPL